MQNISDSGKKKKMILLLLCGFAVVAVITLVVLEKKQVIDLYSSDSLPSETTDRTTSATPTAQEDFNDGEYREPGNSLGENEGTGGITDNNGSIGDVDTSSPIVSSTGEIRLFNPKANTITTSGTNVAGSSSLSKVSYRLIDNVSGVIAVGELNVVNGNFSGTLSFTTSASDGRLDIYGTKSDGVEFSNIEIPIRFK